MIVTTRAVKQNAADWPKEYICNFLEAGLVSYQDAGAGIAKLPKATILQMMPTFIGKPVVINHIDVTPKDFKDHAVGYVTRVWFDDYTGWAMCAFLLDNDKAKEKVAMGYSVSCAYDVIRTGPGGEWHAIKFDEEILEGSGTHLALVTSPRYEDCRILVNSKQAKITNGEGRKSVIVTVRDKVKNNNTKEEVTMDKIQLFKKANDTVGAQVDPQDQSKKKWNAESLFVKVGNEHVSLADLAKHAPKAKKENDFVDSGEPAVAEIEIDGVMHNVNDLVAAYNASKANGDAEDEEEKKKKAEAAKKNAEEEEKKKKDEENKKNAEEEEKKKKAEEEESIKKENEKKDADAKAKKEKDGVQHYVRLNSARDNATGGGTVVIDTMHNRVERGKNRYGTEAK